MLTWHKHWIQVLVLTLGLLAPLATASAAMADASADTLLSYENIEPGRIKMGDTAVIRVTTLYGSLKSVPLPTVAGLTFEVIGRSEGLEFISGKSVPATFILIRVTPQFPGVFTIPGFTPQSKTLGLEVISGNANEPNPYAFHNPGVPQPKPVARTPIPKGVQLKAGGAVFVQLVIPKRAIYVGESVPVDIEVGIRPGIVTSLNGPPALNSSDFTLNDLSRQPIRREQVIEGSPFEILTWHTILGAVKPGTFSLSVEAPLSVRDARTAEDTAFASKLGWPFSQIIYNGVAPKDVKVPSPASELKVLPLPTQGQPKDFSGAVGDFQVTSDISPANAAVGEPQTLRLHISGAGNFDRVGSTMLDHLEHWKTYPVKSAFTPSNAVGYRGEKVFEQPLIAELPGEQAIPELGFSYFNPETQHYERARTPPIKVTIAASLADSSPGTLVTDGSLGGTARGLRPDHPQPRDQVRELVPLYFQAGFLAVPTALALILAGSWLAVRPNAVRATSKATQRALAKLNAAARSGDSSSFFAVAREALLQTFTVRWRMSAEQITAAELQARLGPAGEEIERLFALADEAQYSEHKPGAEDFQRWLTLIRGQLTGARE
jgi:hypothetical protein